MEKTVWKISCELERIPESHFLTKFDQSCIIIISGLTFMAAITSIVIALI